MEIRHSVSWSVQERTFEVVLSQKHRTLRIDGADVARFSDHEWTALVKVARREQRKRNAPARAGQPWSQEEDRELLAAWQNNERIREICKVHERTRGAIRSRLLMLGIPEGDLLGRR